MVRRTRITVGILVTASVCLLCRAPRASAETAYGVTGNGTLFRFDTNSPGSVTTVGNLGIVTNAIDYRQDTGVLYGIAVGPTTTHLYTINPNTAAVTPVGPGFPSFSGQYDLRHPADHFGFDINPRARADGGVEIRLIDDEDYNLRLNSATGLVSGVGSRVSYPAPTMPESITLQGLAYTNSNTSTPGPATLYGIDVTQNALVRVGGEGGTPSPDSGSVTEVGPLTDATDAIFPVGFDILSRGGDDSVADDAAWAVFGGRGGPLGEVRLYDINLVTGAATNGRVVGSGLDFSGGFTVVPEPAAALALCAALPFVLLRRRPR